MPVWLMPLIVELMKDVPYTIAQIIAIGQANGMTVEEAAALTDFYAEALDRRKKDAGLDPPA